MAILKAKVAVEIVTAHLAARGMQIPNKPRSKDSLYIALANLYRTQTGEPPYHKPAAARNYLQKIARLLYEAPAAPTAASLPQKPAALRKPKKEFAATVEFLETWEWKRLRYDAIKLHGGRCQCCGASPRENGAVLNVDHIKPRRLFPELALSLDNLQVLCKDCNMGKGSRDQTDWRGPLR